MKIKDIKDPHAFFEAVSRCKGEVLFCTNDGDRLNMRSRLCRYIMLTQIFAEKCVSDVELVLSEPSDMEILKDHLELKSES